MEGRLLAHSLSTAGLLKPGVCLSPFFLPRKCFNQSNQSNLTHTAGWPPDLWHPSLSLPCPPPAQGSNSQPVLINTGGWPPGFWHPSLSLPSSPPAQGSNSQPVLIHTGGWPPDPNLPSPPAQFSHSHRSSLNQARSWAFLLLPSLGATC